MKIRRIHQPEIFVDRDITPAMLVIDGHKTFGWYDTKYGKFYMPSEWQEVPPEPEWVEVTQDFHEGEAECWENYKQVIQHARHANIILDDGFEFRKVYDCVKVSELVSWLEGDFCFTTHQKADLKRKCEIMQRPMLTIWEKKI